MLGPNHQSHQLATQTYDERLSHAARIRMVSQARRDGTEPLDRNARRRLTAARLAAGAAGILLSVAIAASTVASNPTVGGGATVLIR